ncbi:hypothetical protein [Adlercreutzia sp. ZJ473]|uniref:hypothetical protein n=1 Tax=Adlercreutzia sp. ZJ473 TaxID=2722822 RepID=UPI0015573F88|nr:hypothetical protein [Adlercreutzia sp. ZJ473]
MNSYFGIAPEDLGRLNAQKAVTVFRDLVFAEAKHVDVEISKIDIPSSDSAITTRDGGIDGQVSDAHPNSKGHGIIKQGFTCYQIKTGTADIRTANGAKGIISTKTGICSRVKSCIESGGTLVVVLFGSDAPDREEGQSVRHVQEAIAQFMPNCENYPNIEVWRQSKLVGFLQDFPSLCMAVKGQTPSDLMTIEQWRRLQTMHANISPGESQQSSVSDIRDSVLKNSSEAIRVFGEAGVGKTRLVLEALNVDGCKETVIYAERPSALPPGFLNSLTMTDSTSRCVLVVDECDSERHDTMWDRIASVSNRIKLITIFNEVKRQHPGQSIVSVQPLSQEEVAEIVKSYGIPDYKARDLAGFCSGSPRVAHILGEQISRTGNFDISYRDNIWPRCIAAPENPESEAARKRIRVMKWLALFRRFGYEGPYREEGNLVVTKIQKSTGIPECEIREIIHRLREKKLLQGDYTLYITPRLMHIWLWVQWWEEQGPGFSFEEFKHIDGRKELSGKLIDWFFEMLQYGRESKVVPQIVDELFAGQGPFSSPAFLQSSTGERLLDVLADIAPRKTLTFVERGLVNRSTSELLELKSGRRGLVDALQRIAWEPPLFERAAYLLLKLSLAENEHCTNNATGVLASLFSNGIGALAPTATPAKDRFPVLEKIATSEQPEIQAIAIKAMSKGLDVVTSAIKPLRDAELLHERADGWLPTDHDEWWSSYRRIWTLGTRCLRIYEESNQKNLAKMLVERGIHLVELIDDGTEAVGWLEDLADNGYAEKEDIARGVIDLLRHSQFLGDKARTALEGLQEKLIGTGYEDQMRRYVGMNVLDDEYDKEDPHQDFLEAKMNELARLSMADPTEFETMLPWLTTEIPARAGRFGYSLGMADVGNTQWEAIFEAMKAHGQPGTRKADPRFCSGYLRSVFEADTELWEARISQISRDDELRELVPAIACGSGMTDRVFSLIADMFECGSIDASSLLPLRFGGVLATVGNENLLMFLNLLIAKRDPRIFQTSHKLSVLTQTQRRRYRQRCCNTPRNARLALLRCATRRALVVRV